MTRHLPLAWAGLGLGLVAGWLGLACATADSYLVVTVDAKPAVRGAHSVAVVLANAGTTRTDTLALAGQAFPVTFSISAPGRAGELVIDVAAADQAGLIVGRGTATTTVAAATAAVVLEPTDFVVNTEHASDQFASDDFEASGFQLAAQPDGTWTAVYRDVSSAAAGHIYGRRFDGTGAPVAIEPAGSGGLVLSSQTTTRGSTPAVAASATAALAVWDFFAEDAQSFGVACRALDGAGRATPAQVIVAAEPADVISVVALASGDFLAAWSAYVGPDQAIRAQVLRPDCSAPAPPQTVSTPTDNGERASLAATADRTLIAWIVDGDVHIRIGSATGALAIPEQVLVRKTQTDRVVHARVAAVADGFAVATRWVSLNAGDGRGRIELVAIDAAGKLIGTPAVITERSGSELASSQSFGLASGPGGTLLVAWHSCGATGDDNLCGVFGRLAQTTGARDLAGLSALGDPFVVPTTTKADQILPSVVGLGDAYVVLWSDASQAPPDTAGLSVRARLIYPPIAGE